jgi:hypothetical protein
MEPLGMVDGLRASGLKSLRAWGFCFGFSRHHVISLYFTMGPDGWVTPTPCFFGAGERQSSSSMHPPSSKIRHFMTSATPPLK